MVAMCLFVLMLIASGLCVASLIRYGHLAAELEDQETRSRELARLVDSWCEDCTEWRNRAEAAEEKLRKIENGALLVSVDNVLHRITTPTPTDEVYDMTTAQAAEMLGLSERTIQRLAHEERIPHERGVGTAPFLFRRSDIEFLAETRKEEKETVAVETNEEPTEATS